MIAEHVRVFARIPELNEHLNGTIILCISWGFSILIYLVFISFVTGMGGWDSCRPPWDARWFQSITSRSTPRGSVSLSACGWEAAREKSLRLKIRLSPEIGPHSIAVCMGKWRFQQLGFWGIPILEQPLHIVTFQDNIWWGNHKSINFGTPGSHKHPLSGEGGKVAVETLKVWETRRPKRNSRNWCVPSGDPAVDGDIMGGGTDQRFHWFWRSDQRFAARERKGRSIAFFNFWSKIQCLESLKGEPRVTRVDSPFRFVYARIDRPAGTIKFGPLAEQSMGDWRQLCLFGGWLTYQCLVALD